MLLLCDSMTIEAQSFLLGFSVSFLIFLKNFLAFYLKRMGWVRMYFILCDHNNMGGFLPEWLRVWDFIMDDTLKP